MKLMNLIREHSGEERPYMYSPVGFGCHVCEYYYKSGGRHMCKNEDYIQHMGTEELVDESGNPIKDPSKWCSNWFEPIEKKSNEMYESLMLDKGTKAEIEKSIDMGFDTLQVGMISAKRKGVMLMNKNYQVRGVYPIEYQKVIQSIIDAKK